MVNRVLKRTLVDLLLLVLHCGDLWQISFKSIAIEKIPSSYLFYALFFFIVANPIAFALCTGVLR